MDSKKFVEIKKPIEEVREVEEVKLETPEVEKVETAKETSTPEEKQFEDGCKQTLGTTIEATDAVCPPLGAAEHVTLGVGGAITEGIGKMTRDEGTKAAGRTFEGSATKPIEDAGKVVGKVGKGIKKIFD